MPNTAAITATDQRVAKRFALVLRATKLVAASGEYLCVLRDVSAGGVRIRLFHPLPPGEQFRLELGSGHAHPIEPVWQRSGYVGFRFADGKIDANELVREASPFPKRPIRLRLERPGIVTLGEERRAAAVGDISQHGAQIEVMPSLALGERVRLAVPGLPARVARVVWRRRRMHGLAFEQAWRLDELATLIGALLLEGDAAAERAISA
jgi:PilZ domain